MQYVVRAPGERLPVILFKLASFGFINHRIQTA